MTRLRNDKERRKRIATLPDVEWIAWLESVGAMARGIENGELGIPLAKSIGPNSLSTRKTVTDAMTDEVQAIARIRADYEAFGMPEPQVRFRGGYLVSATWTPQDTMTRQAALEEAAAAEPRMERQYRKELEEVYA